MADTHSIKAAVKQMILREFLPGEDSEELKDDTELMTSGILDSVGTLKLVTLMEEQFDISLEAHEVDLDNLNTIADIVRLVERKQASVGE